MSRPFRLLSVGLLAFPISVPAARAQEKPEGAPPSINETFRDPDVERFVQRFERESREVAALRDEMIAAMGLEPGMDVADIGAGTGLYTIPMAEAVGPEGAVYAVDIAPNFLNHIAERARKQNLENVCTVLGTQASVQLPPASIDLAFICDVYHHFENPAESLASIHRALRPGGRLVIVDFDRREGESSEFILDHVRADKQTFISEIVDAGFELVELDTERLPAFEENFVAVFIKRGGP